MTKLYKTFDGNVDSTQPAVWSGSKAQASKNKTAMIAALKGDGQPYREVDYKEFEVDTKKDGLIAFLTEQSRLDVSGG